MFSPSSCSFVRDLIGMCDSGKPDNDYTYEDRSKHLFGLQDALDLKDAVLVIHDWGSGLGWHYARTRPDRVSAVAFMEAMAPPFHPVKSLDHWVRRASPSKPCAPPDWVRT